MSGPEISWFSALCDDDYEFLGVPDPGLRSSWEHCRNIVMTAEKGGFDNILLPSGYQLGIDTQMFAGAIAALTHRIRLLMAIRVGETWPPQLARQIATLDQILGGRLTVNIISSDMPGEVLASKPRYDRTVEVMKILKTLLNGNALDHQGEFYKLQLPPPNVKTVSGKCPPLYFGGLSEQAREAADHLLFKLDAATGDAIRAKSLDSQSVGVQRQAELRDKASDGYVEDNLWTGIGRARSGCGAALVGDPDQIVAKLKAYQAAGMEAFILSGYPHAREADLFSRHVLPKLEHGPLVM